MALSKNVIQIVFNLLSGKLTSERFLSLTNKELDFLVDIFIFGRIENRLLDWLIENKLKERITERQLKILLRYSQMRALNNKKIMSDYKRLSQIFNSSKISYTPLKGVHLNLLNKSFTRNIRDIDILVNPNDLEKSVKVANAAGFFFKSRLHEQYDFKNLEGYDLPQLFNRNGTCLEIHFRISDSDKYHFAKLILDNTKEYKSHSINNSLTSPELLFLHLIFHATTKQGLDVGIQVIDDILQIFKIEDFSIEKAKSLSKTLNLQEELEIFLLILAEYDLQNRFLIKKSSNRTFNNEFLDEFVDLLMLNTSTNSSLKVLSKDFFSRIKRVLLYNSKVHWNKNFLKSIIKKIYNILNTFKKYIVIIINLIFKKRFRNDNFRVRRILQIINHEKEYSSRSKES